MSKRTALLAALSAIIGCILALAIGELGFRVLFATKSGAQVLLYGTRFCCGPSERAVFAPQDTEQGLIERSHSVHMPGVTVESYRKYAPNELKTDYDSNGSSFTVRINNHGYRGRDFTAEKPRRVARVITLGASSTFGYRSRDDETYPSQLEELLNHRLESSSCGATEAFQVINLGIPHLWSGQIRALLTNEGLALSPDVVTLYTGMNDAKASFAYRVREDEYDLEAARVQIDTLPVPWRMWLAFRAALMATKDHLVSAAFLLENLQLAYSTWPATILGDYSARKVEEFLENVAGMARLAKDNGAIFLLANQQAHHSDYDPPSKGDTYSDEVHTLMARSHLDIRELQFLTHSLLMEHLEAWSEEEGNPFVDVIAAMDSDRDLLVSYVHLKPQANAIIAEAMMAKIWALMCRSPAGG